MLFLPHNKNRPNYHPAVGQLCGSHHVTQTDESQSSSQPEGKKTTKQNTRISTTEKGQHEVKLTALTTSVNI